MSAIEIKLKENRNRRAREDYLASVESELSSFLANLKFSSDVACLKHAAFSTWDMNANRPTTTRGDVDGWHNYTFSTWDALMQKISAFPAKNNVSGWFFINTDGPYYSMSLSDFIRLSDKVARYSERSGSYDFGWVGSTEDCGIIAEFNHTSFCRNEFELSVWGI